MKITFLGASHGYPEKGRFASGTLVEHNGKMYIVDAGAPIDAILVNLDKEYTDVKGVFITHMHSDHISNLPPITEAFMRYRYNDSCTCFLPEKEGLDGYLAWMKALHINTDKLQNIVKFKISNPGEVFNDSNISVSAYPTNHMKGANAPAFGYEFYADGKRVLFTGDMAAGFCEYPEMTKGRHFDLVICEMAHSSLPQVKDMLKATDTKRMIINHYHIPMLGDYKNIFKEFSFDICLATDLMEIDI